MASEAKAWNPDYQKRDWEIVDYREWALPGVSDTLRGPAPALVAGQYFTCLGAAQTHGTFVERPFPDIVSDAIGLPALNLGLPAATPGFFEANDRIIELANAGRFVVLQVMSARAEGNSRYEPEGYCETLRDRASGEVDSAWTVWSDLLAKDPAAVPQLILESQASLVESYRRLVDRLTVPVLLVWISHERRADEMLDLENLDVERLYFQFPQLTDARCLPAIQALCDGFVACESRRNYNYPLTSRFTGEPVIADNALLHPSAVNQPKLTHNAYYPSPEMHEDAAAQIGAKLAEMGLA